MEFFLRIFFVAEIGFEIKFFSRNFLFLNNSLTKISFGIYTKEIPLQNQKNNRRASNVEM